ncbi:MULTISPECIES: sce7726 family protein [Vibrio]|uniref:sce7726 family protein n=1 Tax=Vibrio TaxID=662 RepID=UPI00187FD699|nr:MULTISPECIES: sce7726 family protein [Vibrio]EJM7152608.1 sce7726 family protein [Vibrio parahaemolyticus]MBE8568386.1 sce7726 family protein [Vibrio sp. OPT46]MBE8580578.1 sce7726 family protein [Vibrio sp. OPT41]MCQ9061321.1 sce7726 family protein [Vibrio alginolyticus]MCS0396988.1 sce7726 family protein [Vibrio diabolicus]
MFATNDLEIRKAFHKKKLKHQHADKQTLVIDELGLMHGSNRVDIAVVNGCIHGYEIKSSKDTLIRFSDQLDTYLKTLQKLTVVVAPNHLNEIFDMAPEWVGVIVAEKGSKGAIHFKTIRKTKKNPNVEAINVAHLLWKDETQALLEKLGVPSNIRRGTRLDLYKVLVNQINIDELVKNIKLTFENRSNWRSDTQLA